MTTLSAQWKAAQAWVDREIIPGAREFFDNNAKAKEWKEAQERAVRSALDDGDVAGYERASQSWLNAWMRAFAIVAEEYRQKHQDPETWELRYFKWMAIRYMRCECSLGEFYVVPREARGVPAGAIWYTANDLIAFADNQSTYRAAVELFGKLPERPRPLGQPGIGENFLIMDFTGSEPRVRALRGGQRRR